MGLSKEYAKELLSHIWEEAPVEAALLLRRTGTPLAVWTRPEIPPEVVTVMAAMMMNSIDTIAVAAGGRSPEVVSVKTDGHRLIGMTVERQTLLVLISEAAIAEQQLRRVASKLALRLRLDSSTSAHG